MPETMPAAGRSRSLTTANINGWFTEALADPVRRPALKQDWVKLLLTDLSATPAEWDSLTSLPAEDARALQGAIAQVVDSGGKIYLERSAENGPGTLVVRPDGGESAGMRGGEQADFSLGIFHCTFDAYFQHWHCGWGPG